MIIRKATSGTGSLIGYSSTGKPLYNLERSYDILNTNANLIKTFIVEGILFWNTVIIIIVDNWAYNYSDEFYRNVYCILYNVYRLVID